MNIDQNSIVVNIFQFQRDFGHSFEFFQDIEWVSKTLGASHVELVCYRRGDNPYHDKYGYLITWENSECMMASRLTHQITPVQGNFRIIHLRHDTQG